MDKDFWVVELLRSVSTPLDGALAVFKGGTSLSITARRREPVSQRAGVT
jgi:hypothetical protein